MLSSVAPRRSGRRIILVYGNWDIFMPESLNQLARNLPFVSSPEHLDQDDSTHFVRLKISAVNHQCVFREYHLFVLVMIAPDSPVRMQLAEMPLFPNVSWSIKKEFER